MRQLPKLLLSAFCAACLCMTGCAYQESSGSEPETGQSASAAEVAATAEEAPSESSEAPAKTVTTENGFTYEVNENGETLGTVDQVDQKLQELGAAYTAEDEYRDAPDLIAAEASNGKKGYIKKDDYYWFLFFQPSDPSTANEEAAAAHSSHYTVYDRDGETVIGEL